MSRFVVDSSVALGWCFEDEKNPYSELVLDCVTGNGEGLVPCLWLLEMTNVLRTALRTRRIDEAKAMETMAALLKLNIVTAAPISPCEMPHLLKLAHTHGLTAYDAAYLDLALREHLPLAMLDADLAAAARAAGVAMFSP